MFAGGMGRDIAILGLLVGMVSLAMGYWSWRSGSETRHWQTIIFTTLTLAQMGYVMAIRSERESLFSIGILSNPFLVGSVTLTFLLQLVVIYAPFMQRIFKTAPLSLADLGICIALSSVIFWTVEGLKAFRRLRARQQPNR